MDRSFDQKEKRESIGEERSPPNSKRFGSIPATDPPSPVTTCTKQGPDETLFRSTVFAPATPVQCPARQRHQCSTACQRDAGTMRNPISTVGLVAILASPSRIYVLVCLGLLDKYRSNMKDLVDISSSAIGATNRPSTTTGDGSDVPGGCTLSTSPLTDLPPGLCH